MVAATSEVIRKTPGVMGGHACLGLHRIAVWQMVEQRQSGSSDEELKENYDLLTQEELDAAWEYYKYNKKEIDDLIVYQNRDDI